VGVSELTLILFLVKKNWPPAALAKRSHFSMAIDLANRGWKSSGRGLARTWHLADLASSSCLGFVVVFAGRLDGWAMITHLGFEAVFGRKRVALGSPPRVLPKRGYKKKAGWLSHGPPRSLEQGYGNKESGGIGITADYWVR